MSCMPLIQGWTKYIPLYILLYRPIPTYTDNSYREEHFNSRSNGVHPGHTHTAEVQQRVSRTLCSITLDTIIHGQEKTGSQSDFSLRVNPRPTVSWLWQKYITSIIQIPKQSSLLLLTSLTCLPARNTQHLNLTETDTCSTLTRVQGTILHTNQHEMASTRSSVTAHVHAVNNCNDPVWEISNTLHLLHTIKHPSTHAQKVGKSLQ